MSLGFVRLQEENKQICRDGKKEASVDKQRIRASLGANGEIRFISLVIVCKIHLQLTLNLHM